MELKKYLQALLSILLGMGLMQVTATTILPDAEWLTQMLQESSNRPTLVGSVKAIKPWTLFIYIAADNNLYSYALYNIWQLYRAINANPALEDQFWVLVALCSSTDEGKKIQYLELHADAIIERQVISDADSGIPQSVLTAALWAASYESSSFALDLWNHGSGALEPRGMNKKGVCFDFTTGHYLNDASVGYVLQMLSAFRGKPTDILLYDACLMATLELAASARPYVSYYVASQDNVPDDGFDYYAALTACAGQNSVTPAFLAQSFVRSYATYYQKVSSWTMSATVLNKTFDSLTSAHTALAQTLSTMLTKQQGSTVKQAILNARIKARLYGPYDDAYRDLGGFYSALTASIKSAKLRSTADTKKYTTLIQQQITSAKNALKNAVIANVFSSNEAGSSGLYLYFPSQAPLPSYAALAWGAKGAAWRALLTQLVGRAGRN